MMEDTDTSYLENNVGRVDGLVSVRDPHGPVAAAAPGDDDRPGASCTEQNPAPPWCH